MLYAVREMSAYVEEDRAFDGELTAVVQAIQDQTFALYEDSPHA